MAYKVLPVGICDLCRGEIPTDMWYTRAGKPRLHCSRLCRNTANARIKARERGQELRQRYHAGTWRPYLAVVTPEQLHQMAVGAGTAWAAVRPAHTAAYLLRHPEDTAITAVWRKRYRGEPLSPQDCDALLLYRRERKCAQRHNPQPNQALRSARVAAGLSYRALAARLGASRVAVSDWERFSVYPRDPALRARVEELLGPVFAHLAPKSKKRKRL